MDVDLHRLWRPGLLHDGPAATCPLIPLLHSIFDTVQGFEFGAEITYPVNESLSSGMLNASAQACRCGIMHAFTITALIADIWHCVHHRDGCSADGRGRRARRQHCQLGIDCAAGHRVCHTTSRVPATDDVTVQMRVHSNGQSGWRPETEHGCGCGRQCRCELTF